MTGTKITPNTRQARTRAKGETVQMTDPRCNNDIRHELTAVREALGAHHHYNPSINNEAYGVKDVVRRLTIARNQCEDYKEILHRTKDARGDATRESMRIAEEGSQALRDELADAKSQMRTSDIAASSACEAQRATCGVLGEHYRADLGLTQSVKVLVDQLVSAQHHNREYADARYQAEADRDAARNQHDEREKATDRTAGELRRTEAACDLLRAELADQRTELTDRLNIALEHINTLDRYRASALDTWREVMTYLGTSDAQATLAHVRLRAEQRGQLCTELEELRAGKERADLSVAKQARTERELQSAELQLAGWHKVKEYLNTSSAAGTLNYLKILKINTRAGVDALSERDEIETLQSRVEQVEGQREALAGHNTELQDKIEQLRHLEVNIERQAAVIAGTEDELRLAGEEHNALSTKSAEMEAELNTAATSLAKWVEQSAELRVQRDEAKDQATALRVLLQEYEGTEPSALRTALEKHLESAHDGCCTDCHSKFGDCSEGSLDERDLRLVLLGRPITQRDGG